jgi:two-component system chemotaxis response regulator CheY
MKVLVVDDSQIMRRIMSGALTKAGVETVIEASDGQEAIESIGSESDINLVLMDWNMPNMTGIEALRKIRADGNKVPIVMVTTESEKDKVLEAIKSGANDYLAKPFGPKDLQEKLDKFVNAGAT